MNILIDGQTLSTPEIHRGIGEVFLNILDNIISLGTDHNFFICVYDDYDFNSLRRIHDKVTLLTLGKKIDTSEMGSRKYSESVLRYISEKKIECFWIPNPVMPNINFIENKPLCRTLVTFYDLIPLIFKENYLDFWPNSVKEDYIERLNSLNSIVDMILPISNSTKNDLGEILKISPEKMRTVYLGSKKDTALSGKSLSFDPPGGKYILYLGGFDPRKNMENSILVFKKLVERYNHTDLNYSIICHSDASSREKFFNYVQKNGLSGKVHLPGFISDSELFGYYKNAELLFFPSLYEGFGLPVVEAMAAGVPVAVSNRSSLPELIGDAGLLFDPENIDEMTEQLHRILTNPDLKRSLILKGFQISQKYSWETTAKQYLEVFENNLSVITEKPDNPVIKNDSQLKIAYFSPIPPQISGISQYSKELLLELQKYADVDLFLDKDVVPDDQIIKQNFRFFCYTDFDKLMKREQYNAILYHIGNNTLHEYIYNTSLRHPGIVILHDYIIHPFIRRITFEQGKKIDYLIEILHIDDKKRISIIKQLVTQGLHSIDVIENPLNERIIKRNKIIITHNQFVKKMLKNQSKVAVIPQGCYPVEYSQEDKLKFKSQLNINRTELIISVFGFINQNKRPELIAKVIKRLQDEGNRMRLLFIGDVNNQLKKRISKISDKIQFIGYVPEDDYYKFLIITDIVINLRYPTMGETSRTLLEAMGYGKPVIVSNVGSYKETPDSCCWKVDVDENEEELLYQYLRELIANPKIRDIMGENARNFIRQYNNWENIALQYINLIKTNNLGEK